MKVFNDLEFIDRPEFTHRPGMTRSSYAELGNDLSISVIDGATHYSDPGETYEVAMFYQGQMLKLAEYDQVLGWQDAREVELLMKEAQTNPQFVSELRDKYGEDL